MAVAVGFELAVIYFQDWLVLGDYPDFSLYLHHYVKYAYYPPLYSDTL